MFWIRPDPDPQQWFLWVYLLFIIFSLTFIFYLSFNFFSPGLVEASLGENYRAGGAGASSRQSLLPMDILQAAIGAEYEAFTQNKVGGLGQQCWCCGSGHFILQFCGSSLKLCWSGSSSKILLLDPTNNLYTTTNFLSKPKPHNIFIERNKHYIKTSSKNTSTWTNVQDFEIYITFWCYFSIYLCKPMIGFWSELFIQIRLPVFFWIRNRPTIGSIAIEVKIFCDKKKPSSIADLIKLVEYDRIKICNIYWYRYLLDWF